MDDTMAEVLRNKTPAERIRMGFEMWEFAYNMLRIQMEKAHPDWDDCKVQQEVARRFLGRSL